MFAEQRKENTHVEYVLQLRNQSQSQVLWDKDTECECECECEYSLALLMSCTRATLRMRVIVANLTVLAV